MKKEGYRKTVAIIGIIVTALIFIGLIVWGVVDPNSGGMWGHFYG